MNEEQILQHCYESRVQSCELLFKLSDQHKEECQILKELCPNNQTKLKYSKLSDESLKEIQKDQLILLSRLEVEAFMHITEIKKIDRILKFRKKPILD